MLKEILLVVLLAVIQEEADSIIFELSKEDCSPDKYNNLDKWQKTMCPKGSDQRANRIIDPAPTKATTIIPIEKYEDQTIDFDIATVPQNKPPVLTTTFTTTTRSTTSTVRPTTTEIPDTTTRRPYTTTMRTSSSSTRRTTTRKTTMIPVRRRLKSSTDKTRILISKVQHKKLKTPKAIKTSRKTAPNMRKRVLKIRKNYSVAKIPKTHSLPRVTSTSSAPFVFSSTSQTTTTTTRSTTSSTERITTTTTEPTRDTAPYLTARPIS